MENPDSPPKFRRTCPTCNRPVEPGYKFCQTCGTKIPELSTCSKCGTRFIAPVKYCDLCGAPVILEAPESPEYSEEEDNGQADDQVSERYEEEIPEPDSDESPEYSEEEDNGQADDQVSERYDEEIPEPDLNEVPEDTGEETIEPVEDETPHHTHEEIQEPDTDDLLEQFGKEYDDDETLESRHQPKSQSLQNDEAEKPVTVHGPPGRGSQETVDDALFLSPKKHGAQVKPRLTRTRIIAGCMVLAAIIAAVYLIGLPMLTGSGAFNVQNNSPAGEITPLTTPARTIPPAMTTIPVPVSKALVPLPTPLIPSGEIFTSRSRRTRLLQGSRSFLPEARGRAASAVRISRLPTRTGRWQRGSSSP